MQKNQDLHSVGCLHFFVQNLLCTHRLLFHVYFIMDIFYLLYSCLNIYKKINTQQAFVYVILTKLYQAVCLYKNVLKGALFLLWFLVMNINWSCSVLCMFGCHWQYKRAQLQFLFFPLRKLFSNASIIFLQDSHMPSKH